MVFLGLIWPKVSFNDCLGLFLYHFVFFHFVSFRKLVCKPSDFGSSSYIGFRIPDSRFQILGDFGSSSYIGFRILGFRQIPLVHHTYLLPMDHYCSNYNCNLVRDRL